MEEITDLQKNCERLSDGICGYCKPLMLEKEGRKERTRLLSCEGDLLMCVQYALEADTLQSCTDKLRLALEEAEIIRFTLGQTKHKNSDVLNLMELCSRIEKQLGNMIAEAESKTEVKK